MSPRIGAPFPPPSSGMLRALEQHEKAKARLAAAEARLSGELRALSTARGLTVKLTADDVRAELRREMAE